MAGHSAVNRRKLAAKRREPRWLEHKFARAGECANEECRRPLLKGDRIFWVAKATAFCESCGASRDNDDREVIEFERAMRAAVTERPEELDVAAAW